MDTIVRALVGAASVIAVVAGLIYIDKNAAVIQEPLARITSTK